MCHSPLYCLKQALFISTSIFGFGSKSAITFLLDDKIRFIFLSLSACPFTFSFAMQ